MTLSARAKVGLAIVTLIGLLVYIVIVDYGINAGRIHHGVTVRGIDVGGLTKEEAFEVLTDYSVQLETEPVLVTREGVDCHFAPTELGWDAHPIETAIAAYRIVRGKSLIAALGARARAWSTGVTVDWLDDLNPVAFARLLDRCERISNALGYEVRRYRLRQKIREAIVTWPRRPVNIPIQS